MTLQRLIAGLALALLITAPAIAGPPVTLKSEIVTDAKVTLGDVFEGAGSAAHVVIAPAPPAGGSVMIDAATLQRAAMQHGLSWSNERGLRRVIVRAGAPSATGAIVAQGPQTSQPAREVEVLTWTRSIAAGEIIAPEDLAWTTLPATPAGAPRDAEALIGKVAKRPLRLGSAAFGRDVGAPQVIKKDDMVAVSFNSGGVSLTLQAKALGPAAEGESFSVANLQSKKVFQAIATAPGRAVVGPEAEAYRANQLIAAR